MKKLFSFFKIIISFNLIIYSILYECNRTFPIFKNNECVSTYCTEEEFKTGDCIIDNPIIKSQWLTDIIIFENTNGYISLFLDPMSNYKKLFLEMTSSNNKERIFCGFFYEQDKYIFQNNNDIFIPCIKKNIDQKEILKL